MSEPENPELDKLIASYLESVDTGTPIDHDQFIAKHPDHSEALQQFFENVAFVDQLVQTADPAAIATAPGCSAETNPVVDEQTLVGGNVNSETFLTQPHATSPATTAESIAIPARFGRYRIESCLGQGAMGAVYLAHDTQLDRRVALKVPKFTDDPTGELLQRFYREARAAATLRSPHICPVFDVGEIDGQHYITMAFIEGRPLKDYTKSKVPHDEKQIAVTIRKLALALEEAHEIGVIHRDLKPANIMMDKKGEPVVMDFGLARRRSSTEDVQVTKSGAILGTPAYMSPEQIAGDQCQIGAQSDIFSLGVIMYELMTRELPFRGHLMSILQQIAINKPMSPLELRPSLDPRLEQIRSKMMASDLAERYRSMLEVANDLQEFLRNPAPTRQSPQPIPGPSAKAETNQAFVSVREPSQPTMPLPQKQSRIGSPPSKSTTHASSRRGYRIPRSWFIAGGLGGALVLMGLVLIVQLGKFDVQITLNDPSITLSVDGKKLQIKDGPHVIRLSADEHTLLVEKDGLEAKTEAFIVRKDGKTALEVKLIDGQLTVLRNGEQPPALTIRRNDMQPATTSVNPPLQQSQSPPLAIAPFNAQTARAHQEAWAQFLGTRVKRTNSIGVSMILIPQGEFHMGSSPAEIDTGLKLLKDLNIPMTAFEWSRVAEEGPQHRVVFSRPFCMSATEVTVGQFRQFIDATKYWTQGEEFGSGNSNTWTPAVGTKPENVKINWRTPGYDVTDQHPVTQVTWGDAVAFCNWLSEEESLEPSYESSGKFEWKLVPNANGYRLPTEAEWEYACRAGTLSQFWFGDHSAQIVEHDWTSESQISSPQPVARKLPNPFGLFDMLGNAREWCHDWYSSDYYSEANHVDPFGPEFGSDRVMRGGRWSNTRVGSRSAFRYDIAPFLRNTHGGFRVVCAPAAQKTLSERLVSSDYAWSSPENLGPGINGKHHDLNPFVSADGLTLIFSSNRAEGQGGFDLWESRRASPTVNFQAATNLPRVVNSFGNDDSPCLSADGRELFFASNRPGSEGESDLYMCRRVDLQSKWSPPENLKAPINTPSREEHPRLSPDGLTLYFSSTRPSGQGGSDIWSCHRESTSTPFGEPVNLGPLVNTREHEIRFTPMADDRAALLWRGTQGHESMWIVSKKHEEDAFTRMRPFRFVEDDFAHALTISSDGRFVIYQSRRSGGQGEDDLWIVRRVEKSGDTP